MEKDKIGNKKYVLIDALYLNSAGGKAILLYLLKNIPLESAEFLVLCDLRLKDIISEDIKSHCIFQEASLIRRHLFYAKNADQFTTIICLANLAPTISCKAEVLVYFHQALFLGRIGPYFRFSGFKIFLKALVFRQVLQNADKAIVQTAYMKNLLSDRTNFSSSSVEILPIFPCLYPVGLSKVKGRFIYVSTGEAHKNHIRLIEAFVQSFDILREGVLYLTIGSVYNNLVELINKYQEDGYPIINLGHISTEQVAAALEESEYFIYPSLSESFGLGLIEAAQLNCKIIGADLPYLHEVCQPSRVFDPYDVTSIETAIISALTSELNNSKLLVEDKIRDLTNLL